MLFIAQLGDVPLATNVCRAMRYKLPTFLVGLARIPPDSPAPSRLSAALVGGPGENKSTPHSRLCTSCTSSVSTPLQQDKLQHRPQLQLAPLRLQVSQPKPLSYRNSVVWQIGLLQGQQLHTQRLALLLQLSQL
jgi:hypothetical protein